MLLNSKKAILPSLILVVVLLWIGAALYFYNNAMENQKGYVGEAQLEIIDLTSQSISHIIYDEQVLKQNFSDLMVNFASVGGISGGKSKEGYTYWKKGSFECYPDVDKLKKNFALFLSDNLNGLVLGTYSYDIIFENDGFNVLMESNEKYNLKSGDYEVEYDPSLAVMVFYSYTFNSFLNNVSMVQKVVNDCGDDEGCWQKEAKFNWVKDNNLYKVELISDKLRDAFGEKEVILKAAIDFNSINPLVDGDLKCLD